MTGRGWFQIRFSTALAASLLASVLLGANLTDRVELQPLNLLIGRGDSKIPVQAYFSRSVRGWPFPIDEADPLRDERITQNVSAACMILLLTILFMEVWARWRERTSKAALPKDFFIAGFQLSLITEVAVWGLIAWMLWHNVVLVLDGPFTVRGWPFQFQSFVRAEAMLTPGALKEWDFEDNFSILWLAANAIVGASSVCGLLFFASSYWLRRMRLSTANE